MAALIDELQNEHQILLVKLRELQHTDDASVISAGLVLAKKTLLAHLQKEDVKLYPKLHDKAAKDERVRKIVDDFAADMAGISQAALDFFAKYANTTHFDDEFKKEFNGLCQVVRSRISREETMLYPEYTALESASRMASGVAAAAPTASKQGGAAAIMIGMVLGLAVATGAALYFLR